MITWTRLSLWGSEMPQGDARKAMFCMDFRELLDATDVHGQPSSSVSSASVRRMLEGVGGHFAVGVDRTENERGGAL